MRLSRREENRLLKAANRLLLAGGFPNPQRAGCPGSAVLRDIAYRRIELTVAVEWIDHLGSCSPCYAEYNAFRRKITKMRRIRAVGIVAVVALFIGLGSLARREHWWPMREKQGNVSGRQQAEVFQPFVVDLRDWMVLRGAEEAPRRPPPKLPRAQLSLSIYLPIGSEPGFYEVEILQPTGRPLAMTSGAADLETHGTALRINIDLGKLEAGAYVMEIRRKSGSWNRYPIVLQ